MPGALHLRHPVNAYSSASYSTLVGFNPVNGYICFTVIYKDEVELKSLDTRFRGYDEILLICVIPVKTGIQKFIQR